MACQFSEISWNQICREFPGINWETGNWETGELGNWELGNWETWELGTGKLGNWGKLDFLKDFLRICTLESERGPGFLGWLEFPGPVCLKTQILKSGKIKQSSPPQAPIFEKAKASFFKERKPVF